MEISPASKPFELTNDFRLGRSAMRPEDVLEVQRLFPQIYLACHVDHVRAASTAWDLSSHDSTILVHLDRENALSPRALAAHLSVAASTLSGAIARLSRLGYLTSKPVPSDKRQRELRLTARGAQAIASTSVLDEKRVEQLLNRLDPTDRADAVRGLQLLARAARQMKQPTGSTESRPTKPTESRPSKAKP